LAQKINLFVATIVFQSFFVIFLSSRNLEKVTSLTVGLVVRLTPRV